MVLIGMSAVAASAVTVAAVEIVRSQRQRIEDLEDTVGDLQQTAQQFENIMSSKRKETHETTKGHLTKLHEQHSAKEQKIAAMQEQLEDMLTTVNILRDKAAHFENAPKMFSLKRRESNLATQNQLSALEGRANEKSKNFEKLQMNIRCLVEQLESFAQRVTALEVAQRRARRQARRQARLASLRKSFCWPRPTAEWCSGCVDASFTAIGWLASLCKCDRRLSCDGGHQQFS